MSPARRKPDGDGASESDASTETAGSTEAAGSTEPAAPDTAMQPTEPVAPGAPTATETCPWCSARVAPGTATCPSCGASLRDAVDGDILGVTQIDPGAVSRASRVRPGRLATWLGAENTADSTDLGGHVEPPSKEVREEMLRLELAAIDAEIEAKKNAAEAQKLVPQDVDLDAPEARPS